MIYQDEWWPIYVITDDNDLPEEMAARYDAVMLLFDQLQSELCYMFENDKSEGGQNGKN